jgi:hypothetical protein
MHRLISLSLLAVACASTLTLRASTSDFLKKKAITVSVNKPVQAVKPLLDDLFAQRGYRLSAEQAGANGSNIYFYKGARAVPPAQAAWGLQLGSWFAARVATVGAATEVTLLGKPMVGALELCSEHDHLLEDIKYTCSDTKVPADWPGVNLVSGRDETEVVSWVLTGLYERLK